MAITYPLDFPAGQGIREITLSPLAVVAVTSSEFSRVQQAQRHPGQQWIVSITLPQLTMQEGEPYTAFLLSLNGREGTFLVGDPLRTAPQGTASTTPGTPVVNGANQTGNTLNISGLPVSATNYLAPGDYIQLGTGSTSRLHKVLQQVDSDASGEAAVCIWPNLRSSPANGAAITLTNTKGVFRLRSNDMPWTITAPYLYNFRPIEAVEVI